MTKKFAIIGNPIQHSLSPTLHNYWFKKYNIDANYEILSVDEDKLIDIIKKIKDKTLSGINVTLPYKQKIVPYLDTLVNDAKITSSVNTVLLDNENVTTGENTDVYGLQAAYLKEVVNASKKKCINYWGGRGVSISRIIVGKVGCKKYFNNKQDFRKMHFFEK